MKDVTFVYDTKDAGISGTFNHLVPELQDWGLDPANRNLQSLYWGWFRQLQVTLRADAKRLRVGNKSNAPMTEQQVSRRMENCVLPTYAEPSESKDIVTKVSEAIATFTPAQIEALRAQLGITVHTS